MTPHELKKAVIDKLRAAGVDIPNPKTDIAQLCAHIAAVTGQTRRTKQTMGEFMQAYVPDTAPAYVGQKAGPRVAIRKGDLSFRPKRIAEIMRGQPPMLTPCGTGNYIEFSKTWGE